MKRQLQEWAAAQGYVAGVYPVSAVGRAIEHIRSQRADGAFDDPFFEKSLSWLQDPRTGARREDKSVILVAVPRPAHSVTFEYRGENFDLTLPPTYHRYTALIDEVQRDLAASMQEAMPLRPLRGPLKAVAAHAGFARYGRNNLAYVDGHGSYVQLMAFASPVPVRDSSPPGVGPTMLDRCDHCRACQAACPTGAVSEDRFLLRAERCVTWFSEFEGPLPDVFGAARRRCLVGCLVCQEVCPVNKGLLRVESLGIRFSGEETELLLGERVGFDVTPELRSKVQAMQCNDCRLSSTGPNPTFSRNLRALLGRSGA